MALTHAVIVRSEATKQSIFLAVRTNGKMNCRDRFAASQ